jgi:acyl-CoA synthetase (AMP-forming)/AMP-acid ligase II
MGAEAVTGEPSANWKTIAEMLSASATRSPDALALLASGRDATTYAALSQQTQRLARQLRATGIGVQDRVAIVLPNGPDMAASFLAVGGSAVAAPLNPAYRTPEFEFYLSDLNARALVIAKGMESDARAIARNREIQIIEVAPTGTHAGEIRLENLGNTTNAEIDFPKPDDVALILHTSGTTSRPKIVPLTQANLCASARNISRWLSLSPADRCMNVMPLFHIHGLVAALLSTLASGGSVACTEGFVATAFWDRLKEFNPTWYTAVPTMHQAIVARPEATQHDPTHSRIRFVRSSSAALPPQVAEQLERTFNAPVLEAYGMTEASHQMCCNPLPPAARKFGSVGLAAGPDVAVMNDAGDLLPRGARGEVVIRGQNVTRGYENNIRANETSFTHGWFRTGDLGHIDEDGYLFLAGRIKEIINRGGEKISPREIDEILLDHPSVAAAVCFAIPDPKLGEEIGAAVVLRKSASASEVELMNFAASRLADFKVPRRILILHEIPKGATGKPQRIGLAAKLGIDSVTSGLKISSVESTDPRTENEISLAAIWCEVLKLPSVRTGDDFFSMGGDSVLAAQVIVRVRQRIKRELPMPTFFITRTLGAVAKAVDTCAPAKEEAPPPPPQEDIDDILAEIESMTDEQAQRLLESVGEGENL